MTKLTPSDAAFLDVQRANKTPGICSPNSSFAVLLTGCSYCISAQTDEGLPEFENNVLPQFQQYLDYCDTIRNDPAVASALSILSVYGYAITLSAAGTPISSLGSKSLTKSPTSNSLSNTSLPLPGTVTVIATPCKTSNYCSRRIILGSVSLFERNI
jgi:hypothetical protein